MKIFDNNYPTIQTDRLILRKIEFRDLLELYNLYNSAEIQRFQSKYYYTQLELQKYIRDQDKNFKSGKKIMWTIERKSDQKFIGIRILYNDGNNKYEIQGDTKQKYWRKGYTKEAYLGIIKFLKKKVCKFSIYGTVQSNNENARYLLKSLGFEKQESYFNDNLIFEKYVKQFKTTLVERIFIRL